MSVRRVLGVAAVLAMTGAALATSTKIKVFTAAQGGLSLNPNVDGMAIFKDRFDPEFGARAELHLHVQDLQPGQTYNVAVYPSSSNDPDAYHGYETFTTNASGNATIELMMEPLYDLEALGCHPMVHIYKDDGAQDGVVTNAELRACGIAN